MGVRCAAAVGERLWVGLADGGVRVFETGPKAALLAHFEAHDSAVVSIAQVRQRHVAAACACCLLYIQAWSCCRSACIFCPDKANKTLALLEGGSASMVWRGLHWLSGLRFISCDTMSACRRRGGGCSASAPTAACAGGQPPFPALPTTGAGAA